jgi:glycosyltransferase involved in cell wall biosynthesis
MRILVINYEFPPLGGGAGNVSAYIARHAAREGHQIAVLTSHFKGLPRQEQVDGYTVHRVPVSRKHVYKCSIGEMFSFVANSIVPSFQLAQKFRPDLVHIHSGFPTGPLGLWLKLTCGIPYIMTLHGGEVPGFLPEEIGLLQRILEPATHLVWSTAAAVVAVSDGLRDLSLQAVPSVDIQVIPNGVDCEYFSPAIHRSQAGPVRLLFVGRTVPQKGLSYMLQALGLVKEQGMRDWVWRVIGDGPMRPRLESQARELGIADQVEFTGWLPFEQIPGEMQSADVFVLPSNVEGMPLVLLQAMAAGLPVIATQVPGSVDLVQPQQNGFLVPPKDPPALAQALKALCCDAALRQAMGQRSREIALKLDWSEIAREYMEAYRAVMATSKAGGVRARPQSALEPIRK